MKKIKVSEATEIQLDWLVAKCEGWIKGDITHPKFCRLWRDQIRTPAAYPSTNWAQGGPIIEREGIDVFTEKGMPESWFASVSRYQNGERLYGWRIHQYGPTPLIAAMRCYCFSKLGDEVDVPEKLV